MIKIVHEGFYYGHPERDVVVLDDGSALLFDRQSGTVAVVDDLPKAEVMQRMFHTEWPEWVRSSQRGIDVVGLDEVRRRHPARLVVHERLHL
jgi:hypothetical protein